MPTIARTHAFVDATRIAAAPEISLAAALHCHINGSKRGLCIVDRLAAAIRAGRVCCDPLDIPWRPPIRVAATYASRRWGRRLGREGVIHAGLRPAAAVFIATVLPGCIIDVPTTCCAPGHRRPDLIGSMQGGTQVWVELGATDADSIYVQLDLGGASHSMVLPYAGAGSRRLRGYVFRSARHDPLPIVTADQLRASWSIMLAECEAGMPDARCHCASGADRLASSAGRQ